MPKSRPSREPRQDVEDELRRSLADWYGNPGNWTVELVSEKGTGNRRRLFRADDRSSGKSLAIKVNHAPQRNREQFKALVALHRQTSASVRPLWIAHDDAFFVMEWIDSPLLEKKLAGLKRSAWIRRAGEWLSRLHRSTAGGSEPIVAREVLQVAEDGDDGTVSAVAAKLDARLQRLDPPACQLSMLHGDFTPRNIFCTSDGLLAFDAQRYVRGLPHLDVARFLVSLAVRRKRAAQSLRPWLGSAEKDRTLFFEGYGPLRDEHLELYGLIEDIELLQRWRSRRQTEMDGRVCRILEAELRMRGLLDKAASGRPDAAGALIRRLASKLGTRLRDRSPRS